MPDPKYRLNFSNSFNVRLCYNCGNEIIDDNLKKCPYCEMVLDPNDLKWRNSFIFFCILLLIVPVVLVIMIYFG